MVSENFAEILAGGVLGGVLVALGIFLFLIAIAVYIYFAFAWMTIAKKLKYDKPWLAWIPVANIAMILQLGRKFHWAFVFLALIPIFGWMVLLALSIISVWIIFEKLKYPGWLSLAPVIDFIPGISGLGTIASMIVIGIVAWKKD